MVQRGLITAGLFARRIIGKVTKYTTDGCTLAPDFNFRDCCNDHDQDYATFHRTSEKLRAAMDKKLRLCIGCRASAIIAWIYWLVVRIVGWIPFWIFKRRTERLKEEK